MIDLNKQPLPLPKQILKSVLQNLGVLFLDQELKAKPVQKLNITNHTHTVDTQGSKAIENKKPANNLQDKVKLEVGQDVAEKLMEEEEITQAKKDLAAVKNLNELRQLILSFKGLHIAKMATNPVIGEGLENADIMLVGEAPGAEEDETGRPFVGRSGQLLMEAMASVGINRENIFITNSVFWRPPGNRNPTPFESNFCRPFIIKLINLVKPKLVIMVGKVPSNSLLQIEKPISALRGKLLEKDWGFGTINMTSVYHPAFLLRSPGQKKVFWFDLLKISQHIETMGLKS